MHVRQISVFVPRMRRVAGAVGALLGGLAFALLLGAGMPARAAATVHYTVHYVAPGGSCGGASPCYATIQAAVDAAADGDAIRVAAGTYTGAQTKVAAATGYTYTQVVLVDGKTLTLAGGYTTSNWNTADPLTNPSVIDAQNHGRGLTIVGSGTQTVTVKGFQIVNGDYTSLGNPVSQVNTACPGGGNSDCAGGILAYNVHFILQDTLVRNNTASRVHPYSLAGGILLWDTQSGTRIESSQIFSNTNTTEGYGGGVVAHYIYGGLTIRDTQFDNNHSTFNGGGLLLDGVSGPTLIENCRFVGNSAVGRTDAKGGALGANLSDDMTLNRVEFRGNRAYQDGAAIHINKAGTGAPKLKLVNVLASSNSLAGPQPYGSTINIVDGIIWQGFNVHIWHATVAQNQTPAGIRIGQWDTRSPLFTASITNTLITSATYGVVGAHYTSTLTINQTNTLFFNVANQTTAESGTPTFNTSGTVTGDPKLDANQRMQAGSAAIDAGVDSGIGLDLDGGVRPGGAAYDIGADEYSASAPGTFRLSQATYSTPEGNSVTLTVERVNGTAGAVSVQYVTSQGTATAGSDYTSASGVLTFADGETSKTFTLNTLQDTVVEGVETFVAALTTPTGGATLGSPYQAVVTIQDDDTAPAGELRFTASTFTGREDTGVALISVERVNGSTGTVTVDYATNASTATAGVDYQDTSGTLTFADGETFKTFTVVILNDSINDPDETFNIALTNAAGGATLGTPSQAVVTIVQQAYDLYLPLIIR